MKKIKFFAMALAALAIVSCSKENVGDNRQPPVVEGVETYASFSFSVEGSSTSTKGASETDKDITAKDEKVNNITVTIFKVGTPSTLEAVGYLDNQGTDGIMTCAPIKLTSGAKRIFVFANKKGLDNLFPNLVVGTTTLEDCYNSTIKLPTGDKFSMTSLTTDGNYFMSNARTASSAKTLMPNISLETSRDVTGSETEKAASNNFTFTIQKSVAKVQATLSKEAAAVIAATSTTPGGTVSALHYTVRNINNQVRPVQLFTNIDITDVDAVKNEVLPLAAFYSDLTSADNLTDIATFSGKYSTLNLIDQPLPTWGVTGNAVFVTENTNAKQVSGNTSYLAVRGKYTPNEVLASCDYASDLNDGNFKPVVAEKIAVNAAGDFWKVDLGTLKHQGNTASAKLKNNLFNTETGALDLVKLVLLNDNGHKNDTQDEKYALEAAAQTHIKKYTGGMTYYRLNIGTTTAATTEEPTAKTTFGIKRNSAYQVTITKINKLGTNDEGDLDKNPETPVTSLDTYVTATVTVAPWSTITQEGEL